MAREITIRGKRCRIYHMGYLWMWVADTGDFAAHYDKGGGYHGSFRILKDNNGPFVMDRFGNLAWLDRAVITCFCPPAPYDGMTYAINHKDGNWMNCDYRNLEWVPYHYRHTTGQRVRLYLDGKFVEVESSGVIKVDKNPIIPFDHHYDADVDCFWPLGVPEVRIDRKKFSVDDIMKRAGYVNGDDAVLENPVILHRDGDWKNFASDNLEWVEKTDPRYQEYRSKTEAARKALSDELNAGKHRPPHWV